MADTWTPISGYTPQDYTDTMVFEMSSETKKVETIMGQALVAGEENSQYIKFVLPRYWDGIDISGKTFSIEYALSGQYYGTSEAVNAEMTTDKVRFGWVVPEEACCISGKLLFVLRIESADYILKSQIVEVSVYKSINVEDVVPEPTREAWYREFEARVEVAIDEAEAALAQAQQAVTSAETAAQNAQTAEDNAEAAAASAQTRYGSPLVATTADEMTDENRVYVYTGSETGYTAGNWYYYDGSAWVSGGVYNGTAINTDTTLTQAGMAADAKATGDEISQIKEDLSEKADAVRLTIGQTNSFSSSELIGYGDGCVIRSDASGYDNVWIGSEDVIPITDALQGKSGDLTYSKTADSNSVDLSGSLSSGIGLSLKKNNAAALFPKQSIKAGDSLTIGVFVNGEIASESGDSPGRLEVYFKYGDGSSVENRVEFKKSVGIYSGTFVASKDVSSLYATLRLRVGYTFNTNLIFGGVLNNSFQKIDVSTGGDLKFDGATYKLSGFSIFPPTAYAIYAVSIEDYVASHVPEGMLVESDLIYLMPEMYGAKGDGTTDDTNAIHDCIDAALTNGVAVRGYGKYKTMSPIYIVGDSQDIKLKYIEYSGNDVAVVITGNYNTITIDSINAYYSTGAAIRIITDANHNCRANQIYGAEWYGYTNCIELNSIENQDKTIYYNRLYCPRLYSRAGNCIVINAGRGMCNDNSFFGADVSCRDWVLYNISGQNPTNRLYGFSIESDCGNGLYGQGKLYDARTGECMDRRRNEPDKGTLLKGVVLPPIGALVRSEIDYVCLDVSECHTYDERLTILKNEYENGATKWASFDAAFPRGIMQQHVVGPTRRITDEQNVGIQTRLPEGVLIAYFNKKGYVPAEPWYALIDVATFKTYETDGRFPTIFDLDQNCTIELDDSYCAVGINEFEVIQYEQKKATVYDKNGNLIFDGTTRDAGTYRFKCIMIVKDSIVVETTKGTVVYDNYLEGYYFGDNEKWTIEKLNIIT